MGTDTQRPRHTVAMARSRRISLAALAALTLLFASCSQASSVLHAPAPVSADTVVPYIGFSGATGLSLRDGSTRWQAASGRPSLNFVPVIAGQVFFAQGDGASQSEFSVVAIRVTDGHVLWRTPLPASGISLAVDGATVLAADATSGLYGLDAASGAIRWHVPLHTSGQVLASAGVVVTTRTDAVLPNTYVETSCLAAFRVRDGTPLWCIPNFTGADGISQYGIYVKDGMDNYAALSLTTGGFLWEVTAPGILAAISDQMLLLSDLQTVTAADARTGHIMWQAPLNFEGKPSGYPTSVAWATPDVTAVIGSYQGEVLALNSANGTALWHVTFSGYTPDRLVTEHGIVIVTLLPPPESSTPARLAALSAKTGAVYWERDVPDTFMFLAQVSATNAS